MELSADALALLEDIRQARTDRCVIASRGNARRVTLAEAYAIQAALGEEQPIKGYKLGLISPAKQQQMGITAPVYGRIFPAMMLESPIRLSRFIQPRVEPELAAVLCAPLAPDAAPGAAAAAIGGWFLGVDMLDSIWDGYRFSAAEVVADNSSGGGFLLGARMIDHPPDGVLRLYLNGTLRTEGDMRSLGDLYERLCWLATMTGGLRAGQIIFFGSPAAATPAEPGVLEVIGPDADCLIVRLENE
ncbi:2-keto-4-pentenoate hydratase [Roseiflexus sp.]|uniref:2-keto-4-pentenoate hydratase n=1 Tax=Roseiflexus sp. TaxID=2562120 RepID=UPI0021DE105B|nr:fumarylacetoacetate hydrolase family protein [Roseiflexus sp.]GIW01451.1 MAG: 4-oxalocrotonate decarboxylase [Roseiflexus sp.]